MIRGLLPFLYLVMMLPLSGSDGALFSPLPEAKQKSEDFRIEVFDRYVENGRAIVHFVTRDPLKKDIKCLSVFYQIAADHSRPYFVSAYTVKETGEIDESGRFPIDHDFAYALRSLWWRALWLSSEKPQTSHVPKGIAYIFYGGMYGAEIGMVENPPPEAVTGRMVAFAEDLSAAVSDRRFNLEAWKKKCAEVEVSIPRINAPRFSGKPEENDLFSTLDKMKKLDVLHRVQYIILEGFGTEDCAVFKRQLIGNLARIAPLQWEDLMRSSGNLHNPQVTPIRPFLNQATVETETVKDLNISLAEYGLKITGLGTEKLSFDTKGKTGMPSGMFNFVVEATETDGENSE